MGAPVTLRSSRPTTSAASTASRSTPTWPNGSGGPSRTCSGGCPARPPRSCGWGSATTCASAPRSWRPVTARGCWRRACTCSTPGWWASEMLYYLVGSRELDGGLMCTASHNPKAYTGREARAARARSRCPATRASATSADMIEARRAGSARRRARRRPVEQVDIYDGVPDRRRCGSSSRRVRDQAAEGRRRRRQRHGRADGRAAARAPRARPGRDLLEARRQLPRPRAQPAAAREPRSSS